MRAGGPRRRFSIADTPATLVDVLRERAEIQPDSVACLYLGEAEDARGEVSFAELDRRSRAVAARLQGFGTGGRCAILLYPPGLEFLSAFFGCLYANVIAVPLPVPRLKASITQFLAIVDDLDPSALLTTAASMSRLTRLDLPALDRMVCLTTDDTQPELARAWRPEATSSDAVAYLQYTSGSTASRKGVVIRHDSVIANLLAMAQRYGHQVDSVSVTWLPHTHDLGLVGGILQPMYHGHLNILMSPTAFVQQPVRWLNAISQYRGTYSASPNFGYDLCVRRTTPEQRARLDLGSWRVALNGAEPVRLETIDEFVAAFAASGFRREAVFPAYGLAEATLMVSGGPCDRAPVAVSLDAAALEQNRLVETDRRPGARTVVGCGHPLEDTLVAIVDPATGTPRSENEIGEVWVRGPCVAAGYRHREEDTQQVFEAKLPGGDSRPFLRTGDLGFLRDEELFITGRLKDLIIVRGANHYPQDIEWSVERSHPAFRRGCGAAFSVDADGAERLAVVYEIERDYLRNLDGEVLARVARKAVAEEHDLQLHTLVLLKTGAVPRTPSGKIQRRQCRAAYLDGELPAVFTSAGLDADTRPSGDMAAPQRVDDPRTRTSSAVDLCAWLREYAGERLNSRLMDERRSIAPHVVLDLGNHGILGLQVPRSLGGVELGYREALKVVEQLGAIDLTLAMMTIVHNSLGIRPILHHAETVLRAELVPRLASGRELAAFAITEPEAGSNPQAIVSTATPDGSDAWRLHGQKSWSGTAGWSSVINVFVQNLDDQGRPHGLSGFAVPRGTTGLRIGPEALTLGMRGMVQNTIYLEAARVTRTQCLGGVGAGMKVAQDAMMDGRLAIAAACVGGIKRCLQLLVRYAGRRSVSTGRLLDNPVLLERAGTLSAALGSIESLVAHVARQLDGGEEVPVDAYIVCKTAGSEWLWHAADELVQFLGGRGYVETNVAAQLLRDSRVTRILEGPTEPLTMFLGSRVVNDSSSLHGFLVRTLGAEALSARLARVAEEIHDRCLAGRPRFGDAAAARRWAYALIGQVATDAVLLASSAQSAGGHHRAWAEQRFEASAAAALAKSSEDGFRLEASELSSLVSGYAGSIGDIEQSLAGEDCQLDTMLKREDGLSGHSRAARTMAPPREPGLGAPTDAHRPPAVDAAAIERFIVHRLATELKLSEASIDPTRSLFEYGLDSVTAVILAVSLEDWLGLDLDPEVVYDVPVIRHLAAQMAQRQRTAT